MQPHETDPDNPSFEPAAPDIADPARAPASESTSSAQYVRRDQASTPPANNNPYQSFASKLAPPSSQDGRALGHMKVPRGTLPYAAWTSSSFNGSGLDAAPPKSSSTHEVCGELQALPPRPPPRPPPSSMAPISSSLQLRRPVHKLASLPYAAWSGPSFMNSERGSLVAAAPPPESSSLFNASTPASNPAATAASCQNFGASTSIPAASSQHPSTRIHRLDHQITPHNYTSAKAASERSDTFLLSERDEKRQKITQQKQVAAAQLTDNSNNPSASHHGLQAGHNHLVSPKDLIWESMKRYCAMVLDEESREFLGTAVLFVQQPVHTDQHLEAGLPRTCKSAWVTSVNALAGRKQVLVQNSNGESHLAVLLLTSVTFGLVFLSVHKMSGTFGLAILSMVTSPSSLPHRSFVDAQHGDLVYVFGYEVNSEMEQAQTMPVVHLKLGRIVDAAVIEPLLISSQLPRSTLCSRRFERKQQIRDIRAQ
ncbi:unnamed protein product [Sphagnum jensenii]|uniref:Uncharacterized protein n=1 Tax=Sphagnum jensenii TaxID=128206 RepID=A0ABP1BH95_9BRYO